MDIFHCLIISSLLTLLVSSTTVSTIKQGEEGALVEYPEYYQVSVDLGELSEIYKRRPDYETYILFEKKELDKNFKTDNECGCKCSSLTNRNYIGEIQGKCLNPGGTGELWCYVDSSYANCSDLVPSIRFHHNPWSYEACLSPSSGSSTCPYDPAYSVLYVDENGYWKIGQMFDGSMALISKSFDSIYPPKNETWVENKYGQNGRVKHQKDIFISVLPCKMDEKLECVNYETEVLNTNIILAISIPLSLILVSAVILAILYMLRKGKEEEDPKIEDNYYGDDGNMDSIRDHRVVDTNDYYD